jgi:hypothetical protein
MAKKNQLQNQLPAFLYVRREEEGDETYYLAFSESLDSVDEDGPTVVGTYELTDVNKLSKRVVSEKV